MYAAILESCNLFRFVPQVRPIHADVSECHYIALNTATATQFAKFRTNVLYVRRNEGNIYPNREDAAEFALALLGNRG